MTGLNQPGHLAQLIRLAAGHGAWAVEVGTADLEFVRSFLANDAGLARMFAPRVTGVDVVLDPELEPGHFRVIAHVFIDDTYYVARASFTMEDLPK